MLIHLFFHFSKEWILVRNEWECISYAWHTAEFNCVVFFPHFTILRVCARPERPMWQRARCLVDMWSLPGTSAAMAPGALHFPEQTDSVSSAHMAASSIPFFPLALQLPSTYTRGLLPSALCPQQASWYLVQLILCGSLSSVSLLAPKPNH